MSAAQCWGLLSGAGRSEVIRPGKFRQRRGIIARFGSVPADERGVVDGMPLTSVPRTILDLAAIGTKRQVKRALHEAEVQQLTDYLSVPDLLQRYPRRPGAKMLRDLLDQGAEAGTTVNDFEDVFADLVEQRGLPEPRFNADLAVAGRFFRPDCLWPDEKLIVELDSRAVHATRRAFESDRERDRLLAADGWRVIRVTWTQLRAEPEVVVADVERALRVTKPASRVI